MHPGRLVGLWGGALADLVHPVRCVVCGGQEVPDLRGPRPAGAGLRPWDREHLCPTCETRVLGSASPPSAAVVGGLAVTAAVHTSSDLVTVVGACKYHGVRGLAWPLARALGRALAAAPAAWSRQAALVPVPLHARRHRERGFNQAALLARLAAPAGVAVRDDLLRRRRATRQQARIAETAGRHRNLDGAFAARAAADAGGAPELVLVDDVITSGATVAAAAAALRGSGWRVVGAACVGMAGVGAGLQVDRPEGDF